MVRLVILDWGGTLYDRHRGGLLPSAKPILSYLSSRYVLALVSLAVGETPRQRRQKIRRLGLERYFDAIAITKKDKVRMYAHTVRRFRMKAQEVAVVDDQLIGIRWGNRRGATTIWLQCGREIPSRLVGTPTHTIRNLVELTRVL